jgi:asparagine synthase (glutamine-hydrolysing)
LDDGCSQVLRRMARAVAHRGPDDETYFRSGPVGLGFVRLSLVDPEGGAQPLRLEDDAVVLIANGEIYNHRELAATLPAGTRMRTGSDCEVLLHLYRRDGMAFLDQVRGMFALVLWDKVRNRLVFARDRFGIKPLFYHRDAERVVFGSEIKALFEEPNTPRRIDWQAALTDQTTTMAPFYEDRPAHSWFEGIELVPAATIVSIDLNDGATTTHRYWDFPAFDGAGTASEQELVSRYGELLAASVDECGMADVEIGLFLSGGIDSAAVAALSGVKPQTFTALNGSTLENGDAESAHRIAAALGLVNHQVLLDTSQVPGIDEWRAHLWQLETPLAGPESFYKYEMYRYVGEHAPQIKAMLLGGGADEFNGGYSVTFSGGGDWNDFAANVRSMGTRSELRLRPELGVWWEQSSLPFVSPRALEALDGTLARDPYDRFFRWKYRDVQQYNCWHEDRTAAGSGIEARVPFLDHRLIELVAAVPQELRPALIWDKQILRRSMAGVLPPEVAQRPKGPFFYGEGAKHTYRTFVRMLAQGGDRMLDEALAGPGARQFLDADNMRAMLRRLERDSSAGHVELLLRVVNLGLLEQMATELPAPPIEAPRAPIPQAVPVSDWPTDRERIEARVLSRRPVTDESVLALEEGVLLLRAESVPGVWYLVVDGSVEFVLDVEEMPGWVELLHALDGKLTLAEAAGRAGVTLDELREPLADSVELGMLVAAEPASQGSPA